MKNARALALVAAGAVVAGVLSGCAGGGYPPEDRAPTGGAPVQTLNQADAVFAQNMLAHHQQAIAMARLAAERAQSEQVRGLARQIEAAQSPEINTMGAWLGGWPASQPPWPMPGMDEGGMVSAGQMRQLEQARGAEFDRMFLSMMIEHHRGAIATARSELDNGQNPEVRKLAQKIIDAQTEEIGAMNRLLQQS